jgi:4-nitrophenyl phosphatase
MKKDEHLLEGERVSIIVMEEIQARLGCVRGYVLDMDGVLYRGHTQLPHARELLDELNAHGIPFIMATNNSMNTPEQYVTKLAGMGITVPAERILTSSLATRGWMQEEYPAGTRVFVIGMDSLHQAIFSGGYFQPAGTDAQVVVVGADFGVNYEKLKIATLAIRNGAAFVATNGDKTFPTEEGQIPGAGSIVAAIEAAGGKAPDIVVGKPSPRMFLEAARILGIEPDETGMIGDRLDTDILGAERAGFVTVLVLTGVTRPEELEQSTIHADIVLPDLGPLVAFYREDQ